MQIHTKTISYQLSGTILNFIFLKNESQVIIYIYSFFFMERYTILLPVSIRLQHHIIHLKVENIQKFYSYTDVSGVYTIGQ